MNICSLEISTFVNTLHNSALLPSVLVVCATTSLVMHIFLIMECTQKSVNIVFVCVCVCVCVNDPVHN